MSGFKEDFYQAVNALVGRPKRGRLICFESGSTHYCNPLLPLNFHNCIVLEAIDGTMDSVRGPEVTWHFIEGTAPGASVSTGSTMRGARYKYSHDLVAEGLCSSMLASTDRSLKIIRELDDDWDNMTPDFIEDLGHHWLVVEIAGSRSPNTSQLRILHKRKVDKYREALQNRAHGGKAIVFVVVAVGMNHVISTVQLGDELVNDLVLRKRISATIEDMYKEKFGVPFDIDESQKLKAHELKTIEALMKGFEYDTSKQPGRVPWLTKSYCEDYGNRADDHYVASKFKDHTLEAMREVMRAPKPDVTAQLLKFANDHRDGNRRKDQKCIVNIPLIIPEVDPQATTDIEYRTIPYNDEPAYVKLWSIAFEQHQENCEMHEEHPENLLSEALCEDPEALEQMQESRSHLKKLYKRVNFAGVLSEEEKIELAQNGLWAKSQKDNHVIKENREKSQKAFHWDTDLSDIETFIANKALLDKCESPKPAGIELLELADSYVQNSSEGIDVVKAWCDTDLGNFLNFLCDAMTEVAISNKQGCKRRGMILKKIRHYQAYILISPTIGSQHCLVSFYFPPGARPFKVTTFLKYYETNWGYFTDFTSFKPGKLENKATMLSALICLASYWSWFYEMPSMMPTDFQRPEKTEALKMLLLSVLIRLEDKESTEFVITQTRYMFMEVFKSDTSLLLPTPLKLLKKLNTWPRSRLTLWLNKKVSHNFAEMTRCPPKLSRIEMPIDPKEEDLPPSDSYTGLINPLTGGPLSTGTKAVCLAYTGYLKNKNEDAENNTDFKMLEKILEEEFDMKNVREDAMYGNLPDDHNPRAKEFDLRMLLHGCGIMKDRLKVILGADWRSTIEKDVVQALSEKLTEDLATLKASCNINHSELSYETAELGKKLSAGRIRVLEAIYKNISLFGINPYLSLDKIYETIEESGGSIVVDLFKKKQHGGLREIFVLTIHSRMVQLFIETVARTLCSYFEEEAMTHPKNKIARIDNHRIAVAQLAEKRGCHYMNLCNSMDKTRWSQTMMMTMLYVPLAELLPTSMRPAFQRGLNLWVNKKIKMPQTVINMLLKNTAISSSIFNELKISYEQPEAGTLIESPLCTYVLVRSGMMQGILHYLSSLLHVVFLNSMSRLVPGMIRGLFPSIDVHFTQVCSSDDSSCILTIMDEEKSSTPTETYHRAAVMALTILESLEDFAKYYGLRKSIKSASGLVGVIEFNSEFILRDTIAIPVIKFLAAVLLVAESTSLLKRQQMMYNSLSELFKSGFPSFNTHVCQIAQGLLHYKLMGGGVNALFGEYETRIKQLPDPVYGFFLLDSEYFPGLLGLSFSHWCVARETNIFRLTAQALARSEVEVSSEGGILRTLTIKMGDSRKWRAVVDSMRGEDTMEDLIEADPGLMFRPAENEAELRVKLILKASLPSVAESMMHGNPFMQALASSVYSINTHCYTKTSIVQNVTKFEKTSEKTCLLLELERRLTELPQCQPVDANMLFYAFPCQDRYVEAQEVIADLKQHRLANKNRLRQKRSYFSIRPTTVDVGITLKEVCQARWFGTNLRQTRTAINRAKDYYEKRLSWLRDTVTETLEASPFTSYQELAGFLESYMLKTRTFMRFGPGIPGRNFQLKLLLLGRKAFKHRKILVKTTGQPMEFKDHDLLSRLNLAISIPDDQRRVEEAMRLLRDHPTLAESIDELQSLNFRDRKVALCQIKAKGLMSDIDLLDLAVQSSAGTLITYSKMQKRVEVEGRVRWTGEGCALVQTMGAILRVLMYDDVCYKIFVDRWDIMQRHPKTLLSVLHSLHLKPSDKPSSISCVAKLNRTGYTGPNGVGTPIVLDRSLVKTMSTDVELVLKIKHESMRLERVSGPDRSYKNKFNLIVANWRLQPEEIHIDPSGRTSTDIWTAWIDQSKWTLKATLKMLDALSSCEIDEKIGDWLLTTLHHRLVSKCGVDASLRASNWKKVDVMDEQVPPEESYDEDLLKEMAEMFWREYQVESASDVLARVRDMTLGDALDPLVVVPELTDFAEVKPVEAMDTRLTSDFRRRHCLFDEIIDALDLETSNFWISTMSGILPKSNQEMSEMFMKLFGVEQVEKKTSVLQVFNIIRKAKGRIISPTRSVGSATTKLDWATTGESSEDEDEEEDEDDDSEDFGFTEEDLLAAADEELSAIGESSARRDLIERGEAKLSEITSTKPLPLINNHLCSILRNLDNVDPYQPKTMCAEPGVHKVWTPAVHDGSCGFHSVILTTGLRCSIAELRQRLLSSQHLRASVQIEIVMGILQNPYGQMDDDVSRLICRELGINMCVHEVSYEGQIEGMEYYHYNLSEQAPWIHITWRDKEMAGAAKYDALVKPDEAIPLLDHNPLQEVALRLQFESSPSQLIREDADRLREECNQIISEAASLLQGSLHTKRSLIKEMKFLADELQRLGGNFTPQELTTLESWSDECLGTQREMHDVLLILARLSGNSGLLLTPITLRQRATAGLSPSRSTGKKIDWYSPSSPDDNDK
uniref:RNA-dependent RNA polymerase n=1 Tax=Hubei bunya-like virus 2 TaxID=1922847 RepID=A0A1L3KPI1_9VIRU|nr:RNA-dependent RNA polymerase [Hubei bunya-like virus 2]